MQGWLLEGDKSWVFLKRNVLNREKKVGKVENFLLPSLLLVLNARLLPCLILLVLNVDITRASK